ncbi:MAG: HXXEE domain-containing protein [Spirochaetes bacterium]|nr:HXXEE domain-containing protein [Spirochaetota bacterium]
MSDASIVWLFPVVFMIHDFEELIMFGPWLGREEAAIRERFPRLARFIDRIRGFEISSSSFGLAVLFMFLAVSSVTLIAWEFGLYALWCGAVLGFGFHAAIHIVQCLSYGKYVPVVITSVPGLAYSIWGAASIGSRFSVPLSAMALWGIATVASLLPLLLIGYRLAGLMEGWLRKHY